METAINFMEEGPIVHCLKCHVNITRHEFPFHAQNCNGEICPCKEEVCEEWYPKVKKLLPDLFKKKES